MKKICNVLIVLFFMWLAYINAQTVEIYQTKDIVAKAGSEGNDSVTEQVPSEHEPEEESLEQWMSKNVWEVCISDPTQEDINRIGNMENLRSLSIGTFRVGLDPDTDLSPLTNLRLLREFAFVGPGEDDLDFSFIKDIPGLSDLKYLQHIGLCETQWSTEPSSLLLELYQHSDMAELESLYLGHIRITDISLLTNSQKIERIRLVDTGIDNIEPLRELEHLNQLEIFGNKSERIKEQAELYFGDIDYLEIREDVPYGL